MPRPYKELAALHGVSIDTIKQLKSVKGVDVHDDEAVTIALGQMRHRIKPDAKLDIPDDEKDKQTLESWKDQLRTTTDLESAKIIKEKGEAYRKVLAAQQTEGSLIPINEVQERDTRIASCVRAAILKMESELPPMVTGLTSPEIKEVLRPYLREILSDMADSQSEFWKDK